LFENPLKQVVTSFDSSENQRHPCAEGHGFYSRKGLPHAAGAVLYSGKGVPHAEGVGCFTGMGVPHI
jgi:hypothetical protein